MSRLDDIAARRAAATPGPWKATRTGRWEHDNYVTREDRLGVAMQYALVWQPGDAEFIAHAPEDIDALLAVMRELEQIHRPLHPDWARPGDVICEGCTDPRVYGRGGDGVPYPCATAKAMNRLEKP